MTTIVIDESVEEGRSLMNIIRAMRKSSDAIVRIFDEDEDLDDISDVLPFERIPGVPCTYEELIEDINVAAEDVKAGRVTSQEDLMKEMLTW